MKKPSRSTPPPTLGEEDIRAYAEYLYERSGRVPNRDIENWLEAKACVEAGLPPPESPRRRHRHLQRRQRAGVGPLGFTMPPSDASLWIDQSSCD